ncbi:MAG: SPFH/Band 7/PHB domain protein [Oscillospiraceae bacterium]|nr:SPFH/Band 7/PHB domain protein [Oscillospiraceae bacterium]MBR4929040.1 SPFH/Band 7/PHB domain protein [Oscillospiraceae bacterium]MBR5045940.1 SPFH/Band 7/PHB domain protein [Oscillospiraceae bacterium]MBR5071736.1 SPFH/Band 7/PHB domain protein [Oscillospiraceae bacterium]MBR5979961.1 SPFH/Band 7/PHB domain protein [Oscillospiraceae bacterium]
MDPVVVIAIITVVIVLAIWMLATCLCIVPQGSTWVIERLGRYATTWEAGLHLKTPLLERVVRKISMKEQVADFEPQSVITKDNVTMNVDSVVYFQVIDPKALTYGVERPIAAIENLCATTLRNIIGSMTLDETLVGRETINAETIKVLDEATNKWGIDITRVEVQNITPPLSIQEAMEKQMKAEREKRAVILAAEGEKQSAITRAEGEKESAILRADAIREERIRTAQGEAEAIAAVAQAQARAIEMINQAQPTKEYLQIRSMEAAEKMADGQATKIVVPSSLQDVAGIATLFKETTR